MDAVIDSSKPRGLTAILHWRRLRATLIASAIITLLLSLPWQSSTSSLAVRVATVGLVAMLVFGIIEQWPRRLPRWIARWALQVAGVAITVPLTLLAFYILSTGPGQPPFWEVQDRLGGFGMLTVFGLLVVPWIALTALVRQKEALAQHQALTFALERSQFERQMLDARLRLLQAQVEPHFLFNTLANVQELVDARSPRASSVLKSLIGYLRAAVPRLHEQSTTLAQELQLVRAYLDVMQTRMPDRLQYAVEVDDKVLPLQCPPMTLLTLVENAVRHGIDASEIGGRIDIVASLGNDRCLLRVTDTGVGLQPTGGSLGTGLTTLRERLQLAFDSKARLSLSEVKPHGVCAEIEFPARREAQ
jgi:two-component sensor histidine kinase